MVRLLHPRVRRPRRLRGRFQSHNGAIAARQVQSVRREQSSFFQSHNGAIAARTPAGLNRYGRKLSIPQWCDCCQCSIARAIGVCAFNPTMVRLLLESDTEVVSIVRFQSHNGAIAADFGCSRPHPIGAFNPTMVRLLQVSLTPSSAVGCPFNPTMVRLLQRNKQRKTAAEGGFQSHNGAIAALPFPCGNMPTPEDLSIPQWCDCC